MTDRPEWLNDWFEQVKIASAFHLSDTTLAASAHWELADGAIRHDSGRFFCVIGVQWAAADGASVSQPLLKQEEEGTLGFLLREGGTRNEVLAYAKVEPGNVNTVQLAPTCQATRSNISRTHGGMPPPFAVDFERLNHRFLYDVSQSEQGTRFFGKQNRNVLSLAWRASAPPPTHRWLAVEEVLDLLEVDFAVNTDARSVLVCSPWETLVGRTPFSRYGSGFGSELARSARERADEAWLVELRGQLARERLKTAQPAIISLRDLAGWRITESGVAPESGGPFRVNQIKVVVRGREVSSWDQPIISSASDGSIDLVCGRVDGILRFLLRPHVEPGLHNLVQLGPTVVVEPGCVTEEDSINIDRALLRVECRQSEEGGRFFRDANRFRIVDVGDAYEPPEGWHWLTLSQVRRLLDESGWLTNEARSALALLLKWL